MKLFDDVQRTDLAFARHVDSQFGFLNRSARPGAEQIRVTLQRWFDRYPTSHAPGLRSRFRSKRDQEHLGAFFELLLHRLLRCLRCSVEVEPDTPNDSTHRPDFRATRDDDEPFYVECTLARQPPELDDNPHLAAVLDTINEVHCPDFWLSAEQKGALTVTPRLGQLRLKIQAWVDSLDWHDVSGLLDRDHPVPRRSFDVDAWSLTLEARPRSASGRGRPGARPLGIEPVVGGFVDPGGLIRKALVEKGRRYGRLDAPFVVAVDAMGGGLQTEEVMDALFGKEEFTFRVGKDGPVEKPTSRRDRTGAWTNQSGPRYRRVSAVLVFDAATPWTAASASVRLWRNPWGHHEPPAALHKLPCAVPDSGQMTFVDGDALGTLLGLPEGWPTPGPTGNATSR